MQLCRHCLLCQTWQTYDKVAVLWCPGREEVKITTLSSCCYLCELTSNRTLFHLRFSSPHSSDSTANPSTRIIKLNTSKASSCLMQDQPLRCSHSWIWVTQPSVVFAFPTQNMFVGGALLHHNAQSGISNQVCLHHMVGHSFSSVQTTVYTRGLQLQGPEFPKITLRVPYSHPPKSYL